MADQKQAVETKSEAPLFAVIAEYDTPTDLVRASRKVRDAGYTRWDTFTPFPIHGIEKAMGIPMTRLPWLVLGFAMIGLTTALVFQYWTNSVDYQWLISGKPFFSWPANVPVIFELTILFSAFSTLAGMFVMNNLPLPAHPLDHVERFRRVTDDKFFLLIQVRDPKYDPVETKKLLDETAPVAIESVLHDRVTSNEIPKWLIYTGIVLAVASLVPFALFAKARDSKMERGRVHAVWDMDFAPSYKAQSANTLFEDKRAMRLPPKGTVAVNHLTTDDHFYRGKVGGAWATTLPKQIEVDEATMALGKQQFGIYCAPCHGYSGDGNGMVHRRAETLGQGWVPPSNLHQEYLRTMPAGEIFNTITNGVRNMQGYGAQIDADERWAIVLYLRALQKSRTASISDLSEADRAQLK